MFKIYWFFIFRFRWNIAKHHNKIAPRARLCIPNFGSLFLDPCSPGIPRLKELGIPFLLLRESCSLFLSPPGTVFGEFPSLGNSLFVPVHACVGTSNEYLPIHKHLCTYYRFQFNCTIAIKMYDWIEICSTKHNKKIERQWHIKWHRYCPRSSSCCCPPIVDRCPQAVLSTAAAHLCCSC